MFVDRRYPLFALTLAFCLCVLSIAYPSKSRAADSRITATVNRDHISVKQTVSVTVIAEIAGVTSQARLKEPSWSDQGWQVLGRSQMTQMQIINRSTSLEVTYTYQLRPTRKGKLIIGPFKGAGTARGLTSNILKINVSDKAPPRSQEEQKRNNLYAQIKWNVDKKEVWLGERIDASLVVYVLNKLRLTDITVPDIDLQGFWAEETEPPRRSPFVSMGGKTYSQKVLKRDLLTPLKAGNLSLPSFDVNLVVGTHSFFTETQEVPQTVPRLTIKVKALPPNAPKGFRGPTVGEVHIVASLDRRRIKDDEGIQLNIRTTTTGMLANTPAIELPYIDGVKVFPPTERTNTQNLRGSVRSVRTQTWLIKPEQVGQFKIPKISLPYFDPRRGAYDFAKTRPLTFTVAARPNRNRSQRSKGQSSSASLNKNSSAVNTQDASTSRSSADTAHPNAAELLGVHLNSILTESVSVSDRRLPSWIWWLIGLLGPLALVISELRAALRTVSVRNASTRAQSKAGKTAIKQVNAITQEPFDFGALDEAICVYLESRFQSSFRSLTREQTSDRLQQAGLATELIEGYKELVEVIDYARFAPGAGQDQGKQAQRLAKIWIKISEEQLRVKTEDKAAISQAMIFFGLLCLSICMPVSGWSQPLSATPAHTQKSENQGDHLFWSGDYLQAINVYSTYIKKAPNDPKTWYNLGTIYAYHGQFGQASYALHRAQHLAPHLAIISTQIDRVNQAIIEDGVRRPGNRRLVLPDEITSGGGILALFTTSMSKAVCLSTLSLACVALISVRRRLREEQTFDAKTLKLLASLRALTIILLVLSALAGVSWWAKVQNESTAHGIVTANRAALHRGPGEQYDIEVNIAGGVKLELQGARDGWQRVKLSDGREGWFNSKSLQALPTL
jgi:tetratricopeptide (TPR) repeat protein